MTRLFKKIKLWFKRDQNKTNIYHPDFDGKIERAFESGGVTYYRFTRESAMPWGRYMIMQDFLDAQKLRITLPLLKKYMETLKKVLNGSKGVIELSKAFQVIGQIESRIELAFETETTLKLASILFFDDTEDLYKYDAGHNNRKIAAWKEAKATDFFYVMPMIEFLGLSDSSPADLVTFMEAQRGIIEDLNSGMPEQ